ELANLNIANEEEEDPALVHEDEFNLCLEGWVLIDSAVHFPSNGERSCRVMGNKKVYVHQGVIGYSIPTEEEETLGHRESFCPIRLTLGSQEADGGWDILLRVPPRRTTLITSRWLIEESSEVGKIGMEVDRSRDRRHVGVSLEQRLGTRGISYYNYLKAANIELEDRPIGLMDGKKRINVSVEGSRGGLSLGWRDELSITLKSFSSSHIYVEVSEESED
ncbi:hypothetical protein Golax_015031, partial [Gossypium laxum]|nr:hypothetical protein [Gossypium laxum]